MRVKNSNKQNDESEDIVSLLEKYSQEYNSVFVEDFGEDLGIFIFRSIGRKDFKELVESKAVSDFVKEEVLCETCTLYPKEFDFENCEAGLPSKLSKLILEKSLLNDVNKLESAIRYCRDKISNDLDEQITCVIHEAFPEFTVEEIANWDVAKTAEYMAKSEFILHNLRGVPITPVERVPVDTEVEGRPKVRKTRLEQALEDQEEDKRRRERENRPDTYSDDEALDLIATIERDKKEQQAKEDKETENQQKEKKKNKVLLPKDISTLQRLAPVDDKGRPIDWVHDAVQPGDYDMFVAGLTSMGDTNDVPVAARGLDEEEYTQDILPEAVRDRFKVTGRL